MCDSVNCKARRFPLGYISRAMLGIWNRPEINLISDTFKHHPQVEYIMRRVENGQMRVPEFCKFLKEAERGQES